MKKLLFTVASFVSLTYFSQSTDIQWQNIIAGNDEDIINKTIQSIDGNFYSVGSTHSSTGNMTNYHGGWDGWISKIDINGNFVWKKPIGGSHQDYLTDIIQTNDGNYIACGTSYSSDGDLSGIPYSNTAKNIWVIKFNDNGVIWEKRYGGSSGDGFSTNTQVKEDTNGGLHLFANSSSNDQDIQNSHTTGANEKDIVYFKLSSNGSILSQKNFGGSDDEYFYSAAFTTDGGIVILGTSRSTDFDVSQHLAADGFYDAWVLKIDNMQNIVWEKSFLTTSEQSATCIKELNNGKILFSTYSSQNYVDGTLTLLSANGNLIWQKNYGGSFIEHINDFVEINTNSILFSGYTYSNDGDVINNTLGDGIWLVEVDSLGDIKNQSIYGGSMQESGAKLTRTMDNQFVLSGGTSSNDHDVINPYTWSCFCTEAWIFKLNTNTVGLQETQLTNYAVSVYPNPAKNIISINTNNKTNTSAFFITNAIGEQVLSGNIDDYKNQIDISDLSSGMYFVQIGDKQKQSYKFVKE